MEEVKAAGTEASAVAILRAELAGSPDWCERCASDCTHASVCSPVPGPVIGMVPESAIVAGQKVGVTGLPAGMSVVLGLVPAPQAPGQQPQVTVQLIPTGTPAQFAQAGVVGLTQGSNIAGAYAPIYGRDVFQLAGKVTTPAPATTTNGTTGPAVPQKVKLFGTGGYIGR